jgi:mycofactocin system FadH/OYE family oxidoreductase 2
MNQFELLFTPFYIGNARLKNRIVFLPHYTALNNDDGMPSEREALYYKERAKGGAGLIFLYSIASTKTGTMASRNIHGWDPHIVPGLSKYSEIVHKYDCKIFGQMSHSGHNTLAAPPQLLLAPTQMPEPSSQFNTKTMEIEDIKEVINGFVKTALHYKQANFDGIELKVAHDGLLRTFVSEYFNRRTDKYGGSFENRIRLILEIVHAIRQVVGSDYPLGIRLCLDEFTPWGYNLDYGLQLAKVFEESNEITYINSDAGSFSSFYIEIPPAVIPAGFAVYMSAALKENIKLPVIAFGRINDPVQAETILNDGTADLIGMARQLIADPETPNKAREGRLDDIRHCIACNDGCLFQVVQNEPIRCIQNPSVGREGLLGLGTVKPAKVSKKVVVVGGGVAGLKVSEIAALRGHNVIILEKTKELGGQVLLASKYPYRGELAEVISYLSRQINRLGVEVVFDIKATPKEVFSLEPDVIIIATGSSSTKLDIPGADQGNVFNLYDVLEERAYLGNKIIIIDYNGHWKAAGLAEYLAVQGKHINVITNLTFFGQNLESSNREMLYQRLLEMDVILTPYQRVVEINGNTALIKNTYSDNETEVKGYDTFVYVIDNFSHEELYFALKNKISKDQNYELYRAGDCVAPRMIEQAIWDAEEIGRKL